MKNTCGLLKLASIFLTVLLLSNCVATQSFPTIARSGDTITLAVGSPDGMTKANTTAAFVSDSDGVPVPLTIRSIVRLRPDNTSYAAAFDNIFTQILENYSSHSAWLTVVVIDLPTGLSTGTGVININTSAVYPPTLTPGVNTRPIGIEILAGTGASNPLGYYSEFCVTCTKVADLSKLEPMQQVVVRPPMIDGTPGWWAAPPYGAAEIVVNVPTQTSAGDPINPTAIKVIHDDMYFRNSEQQTSLIWKRVGDDITVSITSPTGLMQYHQTRFSVVLRQPNQFITSPGPTITSVAYYDADGNVVTTNTPTISDFTATIEHVLP